MSEFARAFRIVWPDGYHLDGVQFPSGRCVVDDETTGLLEAATGLEHLKIINELARVEWATQVGGGE